MTEGVAPAEEAQGRARLGVVAARERRPLEGEAPRLARGVGETDDPVEGAGLQAEAKQYGAALQTLDAAKAAGFGALVDDRRGDVLMAEGKGADAKAAYQAAWAAMPATVPYRQVIEAKLMAMGAAPVAAAAPGAVAATAASAASGTGVAK